MRLEAPTPSAHDDITLLDVAYTDANPPGLDINRLASQEELLRLWWSKTPSTQPRWIVGEEIPRAANVQYDELPILPREIPVVT